ncbi:uncharacterized protein G2W53_001081 [Senna tora]|uniref:Uncharacterized protein n=1 Tax=Senna tora TaxID=362788 RepID=A0A834XHU4_9FABA|nr:uncharacterized protein G2W53_001081 [Senna tora]
MHGNHEAEHNWVLPTLEGPRAREKYWPWTMKGIKMKNTSVLLENEPSFQQASFEELIDLDASFSYGKTTIGAAGTARQRSLTTLKNFFTISLRNSSSRVKKSKRRSEKMYLNGTMRRIDAEDNSRSATSVVT